MVAQDQIIADDGRLRVVGQGLSMYRFVRRIMRETNDRLQQDTSIQMLDKHVASVRHYLHLQIGITGSNDPISATEIALNNLHREVRAAITARILRSAMLDDQ